MNRPHTVECSELEVTCNNEKMTVTAQQWEGNKYTWPPGSPKLERGASHRWLHLRRLVTNCFRARYMDSPLTLVTVLTQSYGVIVSFYYY